MFLQTLLHQEDLPWLTGRNLKEIVESLVIGQLHYGSEIYLRLRKVKVRAQKILNSAARVVLGKDRFENCELMMKDLSWLNMENHHRYQILSSFRRLLRTRSAMTTFSMLDWSTKTSTRTRLLRLNWKHRKKHGKNAYVKKAVKDWNLFKLGKEIFSSDKVFKEWFKKETIQKHGNANLY